MKITIQFFSFLRQVVGQNQLTLDLPEAAIVADALAELYARFPRLQEAEKTTLVAVGVEFANRASQLHEGDVLSLMPPLQGGAHDELFITNQPISPEEGAVGIVPADIGGVAVFWGVVRDRENGNPIRALEYTAYQQMADHQFQAILVAARQNWSIGRVRVVHRLGTIPVGEPSLLVRVESAHRGEAFAAAQFIIDELKQKVPIWKAAVTV